MYALKEAHTPYPFDLRSASGKLVPQIYERRAVQGESYINRLVHLNELLQNKVIDELIDEGKITLGIIKPNAYQGRNLPEGDEAAASFLLNEIGQENIIFTFSTKLTKEQIETFYKDVKEKYTNIPDKTQGYKVWESTFKMLDSGPVTFVLIFRQKGDAVEWWREKMGKTHPTEAAPETIRGKYAIEANMPNNLTHGSDSIENAKKEIGIFRNILTELSEKSASVSKEFPSENLLKELKIIEPADRVLSIYRIWDSGMRSESWIYAYFLEYNDEAGNLTSKFLKEKNIISMGGDIKQKALDESERLKHLKSLGIHVPYVYGVSGATLYEEYFPYDSAKEIFLRFRKALSLNNKDQEWMTQIISIAARLDIAGYRQLGFISALIFDPEDELFILVDGGADLGWYTNEPAKAALKDLVNEFPKHKAFIEEKYQEIQKSLTFR